MEASTRWPLFFIASVLVAINGVAQVPGKAPTVSIAAVPLTTAQRAQATMVNLNFRVPPGYHINSNHAQVGVPDSDRFEDGLAH